MPSKRLRERQLSWPLQRLRQRLLHRGPQLRKLRERGKKRRLLHWHCVRLKKRPRLRLKLSVWLIRPSSTVNKRRLKRNVNAKKPKLRLSVYVLKLKLRRNVDVWRLRLRQSDPA